MNGRGNLANGQLFGRWPSSLGHDCIVVVCTVDGRGCGRRRSLRATTRRRCVTSTPSAERAFRACVRVNVRGYTCCTRARVSMCVDCASDGCVCVRVCGARAYCARVMRGGCCARRADRPPRHGHDRRRARRRVLRRVPLAARGAGVAAAVLAVVGVWAVVRGAGCCFGSRARSLFL